ncbi:phage tail P2-like protein [Hydrogenoanaerobacterium saccharovorans]|uniref:Phage tail protein, P2 protein I family n=1 Tax=Hydrogenoanaerobacterium saccharovorans TaxID=474960 RepID=A0A1H7ZZJ3_9FIRM|nr:phage tail protein I [Hydrogenoanaerobacterium saccharovorans]RPF48269.1 phage tail P2-like protein [Hydrogenoanaerobacterium saccharovorans]SEM63741.1 phage tail protein, P2 protein I family [Hydrogenoanaerobacterium saccharovorans]
MNNNIYAIDFTRTLPPPLKDDPKMLGLAKTISEQLHITANEINKNILYARIDELDEQTLDILAYDLHVDWYDYTYPIEVKRKTIKSSVKVHRKLGTKYAVETALGSVFPGSKVQEWFEYGGAPYMFRIVIGVTASGITAEKQAAVLAKTRFYKNLRSHLEAINYKVEKHTKVQVAAVHSIGTRLEVYPYLTTDISSSGGVFYAGFVQDARTVEIYPNTERAV